MTVSDSDFDGLGFLPHVGSEYWLRDKGLRTLILGEGHYGDSSLDRHSTRKVIAEISAGVKDPAYSGLVRIAGLKQGNWPSLEIRQSFWNSVAFANYIQEKVGSHARIRPIKGMWERAQANFPLLLDLLKPQFILVLGEGVWDHLPLPTRISEVTTEAGQKRELRIYSHNGGNTIAFRIRHPSSFGWQYSQWSKLANAAEQCALYYFKLTPSGLEGEEEFMNV